MDLMNHDAAVGVGIQAAGTTSRGCSATIKSRAMTVSVVNVLINEPLAVAAD